MTPPDSATSAPPNSDTSGKSSAAVDPGFLADLDAARQRAVRRRGAGVALDFDPARLALARRLAGMQRTTLARALEVTAAAVTQYEKGQTRPTVPVVTQLAEALGVPESFFRAGRPVPLLPAAGANFRSLRSTSALERERALAFAELALAVFAAVEDHVDLPATTLPALDVPPALTLQDAAHLGRQARRLMGVPTGPVPHVVRLLEAHGVAVMTLDDPGITRVDAFSHHFDARPIVLLNPVKHDKARSRFDAAHELGHLLMHHDSEPGSRLAEQQAHTFAAEFLTPADEITDLLPRRVDWVVLQDLKRRWGVSLKALIFRAHTLGRLSDNSYERALRQLSTWGAPEPGPLGPLEVPVLLARAIELLGGHKNLPRLADDAGLPLDVITRIWAAAGGNDQRPAVTL